MGYEHITVKENRVILTSDHPEAQELFDSACRIHGVDPKTGIIEQSSKIMVYAMGIESYIDAYLPKLKDDQAG